MLTETVVNVISSVPQKQSEMSCEEVDCEEMNFHKLIPRAQNFRILTFLLHSSFYFVFEFS